jgi:hypothetical protein
VVFRLTLSRFQENASVAPVLLLLSGHFGDVLRTRNAFLAPFRTL